MFSLTLYRDGKTVNPRPNRDPSDPADALEQNRVQ
ncbi:hypothetical protein SUDANB70_01710 [Streptomyces sp. enrichment culture]